MPVNKNVTVANPANNLIVDKLQKLISQIKNDIVNAADRKTETHNMFRLRAIQKAIKSIAKYGDVIKSGKQVQNLEGVGKGVINRIDEILKNGNLAELVDSDTENYVDDLETVHGIGYQTAKELIKAGIHSVEELKAAYKKGEIELNNNIIKGLKYHDVQKEKIPRSEILELDTILHDVLTKVDPELYGLICGSYRRQEMFSNDIDFLFMHNKPNKKLNYIELFVTQLKNAGYIIDSLTSDDVKTKYMGYIQLKNHPIRRIDIRYVPKTSFYTALLYFTGSANLNKNMRMMAIELGYMLNEYGLYKYEKNKLVPLKVESEKDVFDYLNMEYLEPNQR